jgi:hypothetical protein
LESECQCINQIFLGFSRHYSCKRTNWCSATERTLNFPVFERIQCEIVFECKRRCFQKRNAKSVHWIWEFAHSLDEQPIDSQYNAASTLTQRILQKSDAVWDCHWL